MAQCICHRQPTPAGGGKTAVEDESVYFRCHNREAQHKNTQQHNTRLPESELVHSLHEQTPVGLVSSLRNCEQSAITT